VTGDGNYLANHYRKNCNEREGSLWNGHGLFPLDETYKRDIVAALNTTKNVMCIQSFTNSLLIHDAEGGRMQLPQCRAELRQVEEQRIRHQCSLRCPVPSYTGSGVGRSTEG
jgi:hypothetical protein